MSNPGAGYGYLTTPSDSWHFSGGTRPEMMSFLRDLSGNSWNPASETIGLEKTNEYLNKKELNFLQTSKDGVSEDSFPFTQIDFDEFDEQLNNINFRRVDIPGDGNCFFRAICYQLNIEQRNHRQFRSAAINYINKNKTFYEPFVTHPYRNIDDYISKMSRNNHYADHIAVAAMARLLEHNIIIHEYNKRPILIPGSNILDNQLNIVYLPDPFKPHYESINTLNGSIPFTDFDQMQTN
ncbi:unnamed protein product [Adineta steineri]|uniref:OTU domain-containing protein n=1 Tax=Adineta steineri TaxID=433720 RepID=A0A815RZF2_9BILA|nr:unnamed protein product [Adineta steineri]